MTLYEINQMGYANLPTMGERRAKEFIGRVANFLKEHDAKYYMMLNAEGRYYTLYVYKEDSHPCEKMAAEMIDVALSLGDLKFIEINNDNMIEFWIESSGIVSMYAVFSYEQGVIEI